MLLLLMWLHRFFAVVVLEFYTDWLCILLLLPECLYLLRGKNTTSLDLRIHPSIPWWLEWALAVSSRLIDSWNDDALILEEDIIMECHSSLKFQYSRMFTGTSSLQSGHPHRIVFLNVCTTGSSSVVFGSRGRLSQLILIVHTEN